MKRTPAWVWAALPAAIVAPALLFGPHSHLFQRAEREDVSAPPSRVIADDGRRPIPPVLETAPSPSSPQPPANTAPTPADEAKSFHGAFYASSNCSFVVADVPQACTGFILSPDGTTGVRLQIVSDAPSRLTMLADTSYDSTSNVGHVWNFNPYFLSLVPLVKGLESGPPDRVVGNCGIVPTDPDDRDLSCTLRLSQTGANVEVKVTGAKEVTTSS